MDYVSLIKEPISHELADFIGLFNSSLTHDDGMLGCALEHVKQRWETDASYFDIADGQKLWYCLASNAAFRRRT